MFVTFVYKSGWENWNSNQISAHEGFDFLDCLRQRKTRQINCESTTLHYKNQEKSSTSHFAETKMYSFEAVELLGQQFEYYIGTYYIMPLQYVCK